VAQNIKTYKPNYDPALENAHRYAYMRDAGHLEFMRKARMCEDFFAGLQWDPDDLAKLAMSRRPALVVNKILSTVDRLVGEQLYNRSAIGFRPSRGGSSGQVADTLTKLFMQISSNNKLPWTRTDVFADGIITSRGFYDVRIDVNDNMMGEVRIAREPSENVMLDPDASEYDPKDWHDVVVSRWIELRDVAKMFGQQAADSLGRMPTNYSPYDFAGDDFIKDSTFGRDSVAAREAGLAYLYDPYNDVKYVRIIDRQWKELVSTEVFIDLALGDMRPVPENWNHNQVALYLDQNKTVKVINRLMKRVRWTTSGCNILLQDEWSPYNEFTIVPYFPRLRKGRTIGVVENLISPQQLLNKARSQELHILNTSSNSGWVVENGNLINMTEAELETKGSETGIVLVVNRKDGIEKIKPNQVPSGLDRIAWKAEDDIKNVSGVTDYMLGAAREDVSAKAVQFNQAQGGSGFAPLLDNLNKSDTLLAERVLDLVQAYYTGPRLIHIAGDRPGREGSDLMLNIPQADGSILNDLTLGEYSVVVTSEPESETMEQTQFEQAKMMRTEMGIQIPDSYMIEISNLRNKEELLLELSGEKDPEAAAKQRELEERTARANLMKLEGEAANQNADAQLKTVRAAKEQVTLEKEALGEGDQAMSQKDMAEAKVDMMKEHQQHQHRIAEKNHEFMLNVREIRLQHTLDKQLQLAAPKPADNSSGANNAQA
jgi:hypothetical protein